MRFEPPVRRKSDEEMILPLINVVFLLLIFFMLAGRFVAADALQIEPPKSVSEGLVDGRDMIVSVAADGQIALDGELIEEPSLISRVAKRIAEDAATPVRLKADGQTDSTRVVTVMEILRDAGVDRLKLLTIPKAE